jgi:hypothetical protein
MYEWVAQRKITMKVTKSRLQQVIQEELETVLSEKYVRGKYVEEPDKKAARKRLEKERMKRKCRSGARHGGLTVKDLQAKMRSDIASGGAWTPSGTVQFTDEVGAIDYYLKKATDALKGSFVGGNCLLWAAEDLALAMDHPAAAEIRAQREKEAEEAAQWEAGSEERSARQQAFNRRNPGFDRRNHATRAAPPREYDPYTGRKYKRYKEGLKKK